ncbi:MAG: hypothetical protein ACJAT2_001687 [Bacteriovoracaceae bacterium]|jgi:hypothetical protein
MKNLKFTLFILLFAFLSGCPEGAFKPNEQKESTVANPIQFSSNTSCSSFTLIRPKVDFLFLWDNSTSTNFINESTKAALNQTIDSISSRFDYHILLSPLVGNGNTDSKLVTYDPTGLTASANSMRIDRSQASNALSQFQTAQGSYEAGVERSVDLISSNISNGIFRQGAYTMIVVMSNQDDNSWVQGAFPTAYDRDNYINTKIAELMCLRGNYSGSCSGTSLNSLQMRYFSIVAHTEDCGGGQSQYDSNFVYKRMSELAYSIPYTNGNPSPVSSSYPYDSFNICNVSNFATIFDGINSSIQDQVISHQYNYWPVASSGASPIDPNEITVTKNGTSLNRLTEPVAPGANGFTFTNNVQTQNTRFAPTAGEPYTGYLVKLYGSAQVTYPECLNVSTQSPKEYFGYANMVAKPYEPSITLTIDGQTIPNSSTNGWTLMKNGSDPAYFATFNIKVQGPTNDAQAFPALNQSGYFLKLHGTAVYSNSSVVDVQYDPQN